MHKDKGEAERRLSRSLRCDVVRQCSALWSIRQALGPVSKTVTALVIHPLKSIHIYRLDPVSLH